MFATVDAVAVVICGHRIPWIMLPLLYAGYLVLGMIGGGATVLLSILWRPRTGSAGREDVCGQIRLGCLVVYVSICAAVFAERMVNGWEESFGRSVSGVAVGILVSGVLTGSFLVAWPGRLTISPGGFAWSTAFLALFCLLWVPFSELYDAPMLSMVSVLASAGYVLGAAFVYSLGLWIARRLPRLASVERVAGCLKTTGVLTLIGLATSICALWLTARAPIDLADARRTFAAQGTARGMPNVILIVMDTVRDDHLSVYGYPRKTTPNVDAFAHESVCYAQAVAPSSYTLSSHASMFTGLLPSEHGAHRHLRDPEVNDGRAPYPLPGDAVTLAEVLLENGYETVAVVGNTVLLDRAFGLAQGFLYYDDRSRSASATASPDVFSPALWLCSLYQQIAGRSGRTWRDAAAVNDSVLNWLDRRSGAPFFLFINYMDPHGPYGMHPECARQLASKGGAEQSPELAGSGFQHCALRGHSVPRPDDAKAFSDERLARLFDGSTEGKPDLHQAVHRYDCEIAFTDAQIGFLFDELKARSVYDDSLIIVTSDHGEAFGEHGHLEHSNSVYEEEVRVPLLVRYPGGCERGIRDGWISLTALMPIILDHLGIKGGPDEAVVAKEVIAEMHFAELRNDREGQWVTRAMYTADGVKVVTAPTPDGITEVYDLVADPYETRSLLGEKSQLARSAEDWFDEWEAGLSARRATQASTIVLDEDQLRQLRSLGYID
ncbi:MAG: sulfatase-like hydrolase/transferase [Phycisphaerales bacterium]|nr:MAG: sulfatase-like hydrolase/transferase [Phycisphaerales bacterium]